MRTLLFALAFLAACTTQSFVPPADGGSCATRTGNYTAHFVERPGGTCGVIADSVIAAGGRPDTCQGSDTPAADNCSVDVSQTCTVSGQSLKETGTSHWSHDGASGSAVLSVTGYTLDGAPLCTSTYDVTFTKA